MCECGHDSDDHVCGVGSCEHVVQQFGPLGLFCECGHFTMDMNQEARCGD